MRVIWALTILAVVAADVSHLGYHYKVPQTSYGFPSYQLGGSGNRYSGYVNSGPVYYKGSQDQYLGSSFSLGESSTPSYFSGSSSLNGGLYSGSGLNNLYSSGSNYGYANGLSSGSNIGYVNGHSSGLGRGLAGIGSGQYYQTVGGPSTALPILHGANEYQTTHYTSGEKYQQFYQEQSNAPTQVFKHFYVHAAPEEPELPKVLPRIPLAAAQKHYKIIFIKTPTSNVNNQIIPVQPQNEEKTIVYVLQKKPEVHNEVIVPKVDQKPPSKPEVFFVKYNNKEDSQAVINNIVNDFNKDGQSVSYTSGAAAIPSDASGSVISGVLPDVLSYPSVTSYPSVSSYPGVSSYPIVSSYPSSGSSHGSSFSSSVPSSIGSSFNAPAVLSIPSYTSAPSSGLFNQFGSASDSSSLSSFNSGPVTDLSSGSIYGVSGGSNSGLTSGSGLNSGSVSGLPSGSNSGLSSGSSSGFSTGSLSSTSSGSSLSSLFPSSQSESSVQAPIVSSLANTQSFGSSDISNNDASEASSSISSTNSGSIKGEHISASTSQGLPHEAYGVPKFRID